MVGRPPGAREIAPVVLRDGVTVEDPLAVVLGFLDAYGPPDAGDPSPSRFGEIDLRLANCDGAGISATGIGATLERRGRIDPALRTISPDASLAGADSSVPWLPLRQLFDAFSDIRGIDYSKMTKTLHRRRPALVPVLDSVVQKYLEDDDLGHQAPFGARAIALVQGYKRDLDSNLPPLRAIRQELDGRGYGLTEVRILDVLIWSVATAA